MKTINGIMKKSPALSGISTKENLTWTCSDCGQAVPPLEHVIMDIKRFYKRSFCDCPEGRRKEQEAIRARDYDDWLSQARPLIAYLESDIYSHYRKATWDKTRNSGRAGQWLDFGGAIY